MKNRVSNTCREDRTAWTTENNRAHRVLVEHVEDTFFMGSAEQHGRQSSSKKELKVVTNEKGEAVGDVLTIIC